MNFKKIFRSFTWCCYFFCIFTRLGVRHERKSVTSLWHPPRRSLLNCNAWQLLITTSKQLHRKKWNQRTITLWALWTELWKKKLDISKIFVTAKIFPAPGAKRKNQSEKIACLTLRVSWYIFRSKRDPIDLKFSTRWPQIELKREHKRLGDFSNFSFAFMAIIWKGTPVGHRNPANCAPFLCSSMTKFFSQMNYHILVGPCETI